jgi:hypothetical protein
MWPTTRELAEGKAWAGAAAWGYAHRVSVFRFDSVATLAAGEADASMPPGSPAPGLASTHAPTSNPVKDLRVGPVMLQASAFVRSPP